MPLKHLMMTSNKIIVVGILFSLSSKQNCTVAAPISTLKIDKSRLREVEIGLHGAAQ